MASSATPSASGNDDRGGPRGGAQPHPSPPPPPPDYFATYVEEGPPPDYQVAAELPTYEEAERSKGKYVDMSGGATSPDPSSPTSGVSGVTLLTLPAGDGDHHHHVDGVNGDTTLLGNDFVFFTAFVTAFLFNWIGFLLLMCFCHTIAARYGALSGFGLSLTKWTLIVKRSADLSSAFARNRHHGGGHDLGDLTPSDSLFASSSSSSSSTGPNPLGSGSGDGANAWLWWLIMAFGLLICVRAIVQYLHIKRAWGGLSTAARERLFFFY